MGHAMMEHSWVLTPQTVNVVFPAEGAPDKNLVVLNNSFQDRYSHFLFHFFYTSHRPFPIYLFSKCTMMIVHLGSTAQSFSIVWYIAVCDLVKLSQQYEEIVHLDTNCTMMIVHFRLSYQSPLGSGWQWLQTHSPVTLFQKSVNPQTEHFSVLGLFSALTSPSSSFSFS